jgi:hypothetical protein
MRKAMLLLMLMPLAFAAGGWEGVAAAAVVISAGLLGVAFAVGFGFGVNELQIMAKEEFYQLIATGLLVVLLVGSNNVLDGLSAGLGPLGGAANLQDGAKNIIDNTLKDSTNGVETVYSQVTQLDNNIAIQGSKTLSCSILGIGFTVSACGGYTMLNTPLSMGGGILGFSIGELYSMKKLITIAQTYALNLLLPLGIVLRTFKITRGAGGFLIALGVSMYVLLPAGIIFNQMLVDTFLNDPASSGYSGAIQTSVHDCTPGSVIFAGSTTDEAKNTLHSLRDDLGRIVFSVLVRATLGPVISMLMLISGIRALTSLAGAEVDVSSMARFI